MNEPDRAAATLIQSRKPDSGGPDSDGSSSANPAFSPGGELRLFRRGKIVLDGLDPDLVDRAERTGAALTCTVNLTNDRGHPTAGFFRPNELGWRLD